MDEVEHRTDDLVVPVGTTRQDVLAQLKAFTDDGWIVVALSGTGTDDAGQQRYRAVLKRALRQ